MRIHMNLPNPARAMATRCFLLTWAWVGVATLCGAGFFHSCGLTALGAAYCWGYHGTGLLGDGARTDSSIPVKVAGQSS